MVYNVNEGKGGNDDDVRIVDLPLGKAPYFNSGVLAKYSGVQISEK